MKERTTAKSAKISEPTKKKNRLANFFKRLVKEKPLGTIGGIIVVILFLVGIFANAIAPYGINEMVVADRLQPSSMQHLLGTDNLGRDVLSRIIYGTRISMYVGLGGSIICTVIAVLIGLISGFFGGMTDIIIQRFVDAWMCFPPLVLYISVMAITGPGLLQVILVLGVVRAIGQARVIRSAVIAIKENLYVQSASAIGASNTWTLIRHILPNVAAPIIIVFSVSTGYLILSEATLSFLGLGIPPPEPSWGGMLSGGGRKYMFQAPWMAIWPGVALALVVYGLNMLGDAIRDLLDPRLRGGIGRYGGGKLKKARQSIVNASQK